LNDRKVLQIKATKVGIKIGSIKLKRYIRLFVPDIAQSWKISKDALTYTFTLRDDVYFHKHEQFNTSDSTRKVVASDFVYSFDRLKSATVASPGSWVLSNVSHYDAPSEATFVITLKQPFPAFLGLLSMRYCSVVPKEIV